MAESPSDDSSDNGNRIPDGWDLEGCSPGVRKLKRYKISLSPVMIEKSKSSYVDNDWARVDDTNTELAPFRRVQMPRILANCGCRRDIFVEADVVYGRCHANKGYATKLNPYDFFPSCSRMQRNVNKLPILCVFGVGVNPVTSSATRASFLKPPTMRL